MAAIALSQLKEYWSSLTPVQKESVLGIIKSYAESNERISIEQYNKEIDEAMNRVAKGEFTSQEDLEQEAKAW